MFKVLFYNSYYMSDTEPIIRKTFNISFIKENIVKIKQVINEMKNCW